MVVNNTRFYPSPSVVTYYIKDVWIDDIFRVDFQRKVNYQPIWGYDSRKYDFVTKGKELVTGNIVINYRYPGYLRAAIKRAQIIDEGTTSIVDKQLSNQPTDVDDPAFIHTLDSLTLEQKAALVGNKLLFASDAKGLGKNQALIDILKSTLRNNYGSDPQEDMLHSLDSPLSETDIMPFDLRLQYGFPNSNGTYSRIIKNCILIGESETISASAGVSSDMSSSAQPILEVYSFFAREITVQ